MIRHYRGVLGWTQEELATRAGYTKRLIAKAESGGSVHPETIVVLAETLSTEDMPVHADDLLSSPKVLAKRFFDTYREYEHELADRCRDFLAENMVCIVSGDNRSVPLSGTYEGPNGLDRYSRTFFNIFERPDKNMYQPRIIAEGNHVVVAGREQIRLKGVDIKYDEAAGWLIHDMMFSRGKLIRLEIMFDTTGFGEALTIWREMQSRLEGQDLL